MNEQDLLGTIATRIPSIWALDLLLVLHGEPERTWRRDELVRELRSSTVAVREAISALSSAGFAAESEGLCRYDPASPQLDATATAVVDLYAAKPAAVVKTIAHAPKDRLRIFTNSIKPKD